MLNNDLDLEIWKNLTDHPKLGELLLQHKKITIQQLGMALDEQKLNNKPLGEVLISMNIITKNELVELLELQTNIYKMLDESYSEIKNLKLE